MYVNIHELQVSATILFGIPLRPASLRSQERERERERERKRREEKRREERERKRGQSLAMVGDVLLW